MNTLSENNNSRSYKKWLLDLKQRYQSQQIKAAIQVNRALLEFYWDLGRDIAERQLENVYGSGFYRKLSNDLRQELPDAKGFSPTNLKYFKYFYELYHQEIANRQQPVDGFGADELFSIPWGHHVQIINRCGRDVKKAFFYVRKTIEFNWSRSVLMNFLDTGLYEREGKAISNFQTALPLPQGDLAQEITKDPYNFNFLTLDKSYHENDLKKALLANITKFRL